MMAGIEQMIERVHGDDTGHDGPVLYGVVSKEDSWRRAFQYVRHSTVEAARDTVRWADLTYPHHAPHRIVVVRLALVEDGVA